MKPVKKLMALRDKCMDAQYRAMASAEIESARIGRAMRPMAVAGLAFMSASALAASQTGGDLVENVAADSQKFVNGAVYLMYACGVFFAGNGIFRLIKKSNGDHQITGGSIAGNLGGGAALAAVAGVLQAVTGTVGAEGGSIQSFNR